MKILRIVLALLLTGGFIVLFLRQVDFDLLGHSLTQANFGLIIASIPLIILSMLWRAWRWREILSPLRRSSVLTVLRVTSVGYMANNLLPARAGELVRAYIYGEEEKVSKMSTMATIAIERVVDLIVLLILLGLGAAFIPTAYIFQAIGEQSTLSWLAGLTAIAIVFIGLILLLVAAALIPDKLLNIFKVLISFFPQSWRQKLYSLGERFVAGTALLKNPRRLATVFGLSLLVWLTEIGMYHMVGLAFALDQPYSVFIIATTISNLLLVIPTAMAGIGAFDWGIKVVMTYFGANPSLAAAYTIVLHAAIVLPIVAMGLVFLWSTRRSLTSIITYITPSKRRTDVKYSSK